MARHAGGIGTVRQGLAWVTPVTKVTLHRPDRTNQRSFNADAWLSLVEHLLDTEKVIGSNPVASTHIPAWSGESRLGWAGHGQARHGAAWHGMVQYPLGVSSNGEGRLSYMEVTRVQFSPRLLLHFKDDQSVSLLCSSRRTRRNTLRKMPSLQSQLPSEMVCH